MSAERCGSKRLGFVCQGPRRFCPDECLVYAFDRARWAAAT